MHRHHRHLSLRWLVSLICVIGRGGYHGHHDGTVAGVSSWLS